MRFGILIALFALGCPSPSEPKVEKPAEPAAKPAEPPVTAADLGQAESTAIVPSPVETQRALTAAGIETELHTLITDHGFDATLDDPDATAVRTGVLLADLLLTVKPAATDDLKKRLTDVREGLNKLQGGADIDKTLADILERVGNESVTRDQLLYEFDTLSGAAIPELKFNGRERIVPLIQAGSWLEAANLLAKAVKAKGQPGAADALLKQPAVVDYFLRYVKEEGGQKTTAAIAGKLESSLNELKALAEKKEALVAEDIDKVIQVTDDVLALL